MFLTHWVLLVIGLGSIWLGVNKITEEVYRIAVIFTGFILLVWGFSAAPAIVQLLLEILFLWVVLPSPAAIRVGVRDWQQAISLRRRGRS